MENGARIIPFPACQISKMSSAYVRANKTLYTSFIGYLTKNGKKNIAKRIIDDAFATASKATKLPAQVVLLETFKKLNTLVEVKSVKIGAETHMIPFTVSFKRRSYLVVKWLMQAVDSDKRKVSTSEKLSLELVNTIKGKTSRSLQHKEQNTQQALQNRANIHFRW